ncbi:MULTISPECIES: AraC family transcriptional regulator [unclassified Clostridium]|uniref:AraC family transcriptional regulator n=1 Tax=unclassified Clostridium TaxID=2614128 RepID=UPI001C8BAC63|nr:MULTISPECIES: AraC family transcriptional regulator [unclassified Clostridium]MBX9138612.1 AraC family transcriptional regulator [Clostridium sp. K12(2020)]MBX9145380.1 AraC family transcriptional regulator [Clostridium sp. K13]
MNKENITHEIIQPAENLDAVLKLFNDTGSYTPRHWHNSIEILYITSGNLQVDIGKYSYALKKDDCILINSGNVHSTRCIDGNTSILLQIPSGLLKRYIPNYKNHYFDLSINSNDGSNNENLNKIKEILKSMKDLKTYPCEVGHLRFASLLFEFLFLLYNNFRITITNDKLNHSNVSLSNLEPVLDFTRQNYNKHISIKEVADVAHLQPEYFCRKFKQFMGQTYLDYLNEIRLSHIYMDLLNTKDSISNIMERHGFSNYKLFYKIFKEKFNCTPREVRKNK